MFETYQSSYFKIGIGSCCGKLKSFENKGGAKILCLDKKLVAQMMA
jgi:hypothetical protein